MFFSVAEQDVNLKGAAVRFYVDRTDTAKVVLTILAPIGLVSEEHYRLTFQRNGQLISSLGPEELAAERAEAAEKAEAIKAQTKEVHDAGKQADDGPARGHDQPVGQGQRPVDEGTQRPVG